MNGVELLSEYLMGKAQDDEEEITVDFKEFIGVVDFVEFLEKQDKYEKEKKEKIKRKAILNLLKELNEKNLYRIRLTNDAWAGNKTKEDINAVTKEIEELHLKINTMI